MLDPTFRNHLKHGSKNSKMISWKIQNEVIEYLATFARFSDHFAVIDEVTDRFSNPEVLLLCLQYVTFHNKRPKVCETFYDSLQIFKEGQVDKLLKIAFYLCYKETITIF